MPVTARAIRLAARPEGTPTDETFRLTEDALPDPAPGEVAIRVIWLSLDPYMRGRMDPGPSYADPVEVGDVMPGQSVGEVIASRAEGIAEGDIVTGFTGWCDHAVVSADGLRRLDPARAPIQTALGVLGMPGMTAWTGLNLMLEAQPDETVAISAATGAVGAVAGQLARRRGCHVVGIAGGPEKCEEARTRLGYHTCIDHHAHPDGAAMGRAIAEAAPGGIDGYFENVAGKTLSGIVPHMRQDGRIAVCGMVAWYNGHNLDQALPLPQVWRAILTQRLTVRGYIVADHFERFGDFLDEVAPLVANGKLHYREDITEGLEHAPEAFLGMLGGQNFGKTLVRVGADP